MTKKIVSAVSAVLLTATAVSYSADDLRNLGDALLGKGENYN